MVRSDSNQIKLKPPDCYYKWRAYLADRTEVNQDSKPAGFDPMTADNVVKVAFIPVDQSLPELSHSVPKGAKAVCFAYTYNPPEDTSKIKDLEFVLGFTINGASFGYRYGITNGVSEYYELAKEGVAI
jgi:hypothetical protein